MNILFEPHKKQEEFIDAILSDDYRCLMYGGAAGGGKTFVSLAVFVLLAKVYPGSRWFVVRESLPTLKRTTIPSFLKLCPRQFIRSYNQTDQIVTFRNGSQLTFFPENYVQDKNLTRFDGIEANGFLIEEGQEIQSKTFEKCKLRAGRHIIPGIAKQPKPIILITCNPSNNWTKKEFHEPSIEGTLRDDYFYLRATMSDNPSLPDDYLEGLENLDEVTKAVFVRGDWNVVDVDRPFVYAFDKKKTVVKGLEIDQSEPIILSFDFNVDPITCVAGQSYDGKIRILKEFRLRNSDIYRLCEAIFAEFGDVYFIVTGDASGSARSAMTKGALNYYSIIKQELDLSKGQFKVPSVNPSIRNSRVLCNAIAANHEDFMIDSSCHYLIEDLETVETNDQGDIDKGKDAHKSHLLDCFRYFLWTFHNDFVRFR
jgi:hypothetical protein|tara:strand:- start:2675 stop:3952 length:1278 start_codon:yes stop_codon:yes gene_type:complete